ncbi:MAG: biopolymer transporter ExbD, partial [Hyphomicrobiales bacterium]|nr:biopolymer transporter ExbD [Hyphomicrobiales bacterium]
LAAAVSSRLGQSNGVVQLRGDRDAVYGDIVAAMDELAANGVSRIAIVLSGRKETPAAPAQAKP